MDASPARLSVILPASNEAAHIDACLGALLASTEPDATRRLDGTDVIVVANGCDDDTAARAERRSADFAARGWRLTVIDTPQGGKMNALNLGDRAAAGTGCRVYLDADVVVGPPLLAQLAEALDRPEPAWASGRPRVAAARSAVTRAYARFWTRLPFMTHGVPGFGIFAVNAAGRARWGEFPDIISDDTFVRLNFAPGERIGVPADYRWPMAEGFARLVRVRRRQDAGVREVLRRFPALASNDETPRAGPGRIAAIGLRDPVGLAVYGAVALAVRATARRGARGWARGR
jgi:glycosyltransferase involved in cell wall biosynthesis